MMMVAHLLAGASLVPLGTIVHDVLPVVAFPMLAVGLAGIGAVVAQRKMRIQPSTLRDALLRGAREMRRRQLELRPLSAEKRNRYVQLWNEIGKRFRDEPPQAIDDAGSLLDQVFTDMGYPPGDATIRAEDLEGAQPQAAAHFRTAAAIAHKSKRGTATIAELHAAFDAYRRVFTRLLQTQPA
jgi:hypothetical protein